MTVSVDKKTLKIIFSICVLAVAICIADCVSEIRATADYSKADGTLVSIDRSIDWGTESNTQVSIIRNKVYQYQVNQQEYTCQYRTYILFQPKIGSHKTIYYSSSNPNQVRDEFKIQTAKAGAVFFAFFGIMMLVFMKKAGEMNKRSKLIVCGIAVIAVLCMALPVFFHGTSNECKITGVLAADSRNHSVDTYTVEQDKKKCSVSFSDTAVIDTAFTAEVPTDEPYIIELTVRDSQLPEYREIKDENVAMNTAQTAAKYNADDSVMKRVVYPQNRQLHFLVTTQYKENVSGFIDILP